MCQAGYFPGGQSRGRFGINPDPSGGQACGLTTSASLRGAAGNRAAAPPDSVGAVTVYYDRLARARSDLDDIADWLSELYADREKGTPRHWAEGKRTEVEGRSGPPGATAPARLDVLDTVADLEVSVRELVDAICDRLDRSGPALAPGPSEAVARTRLIWLRAQLPVVGDHDDLAEHVEDEARRLVRAVRRATGQLLPIQTLRLTCPLCDGVSRLAANHNTGRIACPDCGMVWSDNVSGVGGWDWLRQLMMPTVSAKTEYLLTTAEAAAYVGVRSENIRDWQRSGHLEPAGKRGLSNTYRSADVLEARRVTMAPAGLISPGQRVGTHDGSPPGFPGRAAVAAEGPR